MMIFPKPRGAESRDRLNNEVGSPPSLAMSSKLARRRLDRPRGLEKTIGESGPSGEFRFGTTGLGSL